MLEKAGTRTDGVTEIGSRGAWPCARLWNGVGRSQRGAGGGSEEDNPQAEMKAAAVGVRAWHCRGCCCWALGISRGLAVLRAG